MKPIFTIHAGEFIVGEYIQRHFPRINLWLPSKDTGIDILLSSNNNKSTISLQVKYSRDFLTDLPSEFQKPIRACGWWTLNRAKIVNSKADYWIFLLVGFDRRSEDFIIMKPKELIKRFDKMHNKQNIIQSYFWVTESNRCWETRNLPRNSQRLIAQNIFKSPERNFTEYLNNWEIIKKLNK